MKKLIIALITAITFTGCSSMKIIQFTGNPIRDAKSYSNECQQDLEEIRRIFDETANYKGEKTVQSILLPLNDLDIVLDNSASKASLFYHNHPNEDIRKVAETQQQEITKIATEIGLSRPLYDACVAADIKDADAETKRHHKHLLRDFRRSGVDKDEKTRTEIKKIRDELIVLGQEFSKNIREDVRTIELDSADELAGLPEDYIKSHQPNEDGKIVITTDYPDYIPFSNYAHNDEKRLEIYMKFRNRGYPKNKKVLESILQKRYRLAKTLGYKNYAEYITETKMIKSAGNAKKFITKISAVSKRRANMDYQILLKRLKQTDPKAKEVGDWQKGYITELVRQEDYQVDSRTIREYFQFAKVRDGIFNLVSTMFDITIRPWKTDVWHESVRAYEVVEGDEVIGRFYLDMHPRENKYKHAAHFSLSSGVKGRQLPVSALVCNFPGNEDENELMEHSQVNTFLHEFGHMMHHIFAMSDKWLAFSGISTEWDFVEAPSQMLEEWVWDGETLKSFAVNGNGESIPDELIKKMNIAKDFGKGLRTRHQMFYASMSLNFYNCNPKGLDIDKEIKNLQNKYSPYKYVDDTYMYASFGHLYGYSAIYYTYMWSQVIAKDMFTRFENEGMLNSKTASEYKSCILSPGGSKDADELVRAFLGRDYNFDAFSDWLNNKE